MCFEIEKRVLRASLKRNMIVKHSLLVEWLQPNTLRSALAVTNVKSWDL